MKSFMKQADIFNIGFISAMIEHLPYHIFWKNKDLKFMGCNQKFAAQFGLSASEEILYSSDEDFPWSDELRKKYILDDLTILKEGKPKLGFIERQRQTDGSFKIVNVSKMPIYAPNKRIIGIYGQYIDCTKKALLENKLTGQERKCFHLLIKGYSCKLIAKKLQLSPRTIEIYINQIKIKLDCSTKAQVIEKAEDAGFI